MKKKSHVPKGNNKNNWSTAKANFSGNNDSLEIFGNPVMESWEEPYMKKLSETATLNGGKVLEIGFGLGIASTYIQKSNANEHYIIEANESVYKNLIKFSNNAKIKINNFFGLWQDQITNFDNNYFDGILYDTYPLNESELHTHQFEFIKIAYNILKPNGVLTYCNFTSWGNLMKEYKDEFEMFQNTQIPELNRIGFKNIKLHRVNINPPKSCNYYQFNKIIAPEIRK